MIPAHLLIGIPKGEWVALSHSRDRLIAHSVELQEALRKAYAEGEKDPFVLRIPNTMMYSR